jgi:hypothetical protein
MTTSKDEKEEEEKGKERGEEEASEGKASYLMLISLLRCPSSLPPSLLPFQEYTLSTKSSIWTCSAALDRLARF